MKNVLATAAPMEHGASHGGGIAHGAKNRGPWDRSHIEPVDNGITVTTHYLPKSQNGPYPQPEKMVFTDHKAAHAHIGKIMAEDAGESAAKEKAEAKKGEK